MSLIEREYAVKELEYFKFDIFVKNNSSCAISSSGVG